MAEKPLTASDYMPEDALRVKVLCLHLAVTFGDLLGDLVVVGGMVPSLLIAQDHLPEGAISHAGTKDLDLGLSLGVLDQERYRALADRLRSAGFEPDTNREGRQTRQRWRHRDHTGLTVDFLISPTKPGERGGTLRNLETDLAAVITPGLGLAFRDRVAVRLKGKILSGEHAERRIQVCGPGAFVVLKALAFRSRGEAKDAYDLFYVIRNGQGGPAAVAGCLRPLASDPEAARALAILREDFLEPGQVGAERAARFLGDRALRVEVSGFVRRLLDAL